MRSGQSANVQKWLVALMGSKSSMTGQPSDLVQLCAVGLHGLHAKLDGGNPINVRLCQRALGRSCEPRPSSDTVNDADTVSTMQR